MVVSRAEGNGEVVNGWYGDCDGRIREEYYMSPRMIVSGKG